MIDSPLLTLYGIVVVLTMLGFIVVPVLRRKSDLVTGWNTLLLGILIYAGLGSIEVRYTPLAWQHLQWFLPSSREIHWYIAATTAFIATLLVAYYYNAPARVFASRRLRKWPPINGPVITFVLLSCLTIVVGSLFTGRIFFIGPLLSNLAHKAAVFACTFSFYMWYRQRLNIASLGIFIVVLLMASMYSMVFSGGRRLLLSMFLGPILCAYWIHARHWKPARILASMGFAAAFILAISAVYSTFRWYNLGHTSQERTATGIVDQIRDLRTRENLFGFILAHRLSYFAQSNAQFALLTQRFVSEKRLVPKPLNTLRFVASYPIPRRMWEEKPEVIGLTITRDVAGIQTTNWGIGISGHGAYEGGIPALMLYAVLIAFFIQCMDEPLRLQPGNPFLIGLHAAALPHVVAIPRGDFGIMITEAAECFLFAFAMGLACRALFGTERHRTPSYASTTQLQYGYPSVQQPYRAPRITR
jgi:hypothetical protein